MKKIYALTLGCPKNLVDTEKLLFVRFGEYRLVTEPEHADIILINTCSFILPAKEEGSDTIFEMVEIAKGSPSPKRIIVTGCMVEQYGAQLQADLPEVELFSDQDMLYYDGRVVTTSPFAYLKIAEGCSRQCAFCTIPSFKGPYRSRQMKDILSEAALLKGKTQELIIVSQDSSNYGMDQGKALLPELLLRLSDLGFPWIRLLYL
ncbi:MAG: 30S ribosomal protein S12 methylthiotransferase RimO, partial [Spirochaetae bacterium HGW-Spirochaetae-6]